MSARDMAINIVNMMDEEQLTGFVKLFNPIICDIPNEETIKAMKETEEMLNDPTVKKFDSVASLFEDLRTWNIKLKEQDNSRKILN